MTKPGRGDGEGPCPHGALVHGPVGGEDIDNLIGPLGRALPRIIIIQGVTGNHALPGITNDSWSKWLEECEFAQSMGAEEAHGTQTEWLPL